MTVSQNRQVGQTNYHVNPAKAIKGMALGRFFSKPRTLAWLGQVSTAVLATYSVDGDWEIRVTDVKTGQQYSMVVAITTDIPTALDEILAAWTTNGPLNNLFSVTEDGVDTLTITARHFNRSYTFEMIQLPGTLTTVFANTQNSGGDGIEPGSWVRRGAGDLEIDALTGTTTLAELEGILRRTDMNHFHSLENDGPSEVDRLDRGRTHEVLEPGSRVWVLVEDAVTPASTPFVRRSGTGTIGAMRGTADGGNTLDVSTLCKFETSAGAGELVQLVLT